MKIVLFSVLCCACFSNGEEKRQDINFEIITTTEGDVYCKANPKEIIVNAGETVKLYSSIFFQEGIWRAECTYNNGTGDHSLGGNYIKERDKSSWFLDVNDIKKHQFGDWRCELGFNKNNDYGLNSYDQDRCFTYINCTARVRSDEVDGTPDSGRSLQSNGMEPKTMFIIGGVGICVIVIIIAQAIALCYFKRKAQPRRRMDKMTSRSAFDRGDRARYSAPPCRKNSKSNTRAQADTDSHIYEMVGVNALYKQSNELQQEIRGDTNTAERSIKDRPPLPLPHEVPEPSPVDTLPRPKPLKSTPSTLSLNSSCSSAGTMTWKKKGKEVPPPPGTLSKKAPARPPKQIDEVSIPGSLKRLPKTSPALVPPKGDSIPRMPANDPNLMELKNAFKKRNLVNDSPAPSPTSTLEKKPKPPMVQSKPNKPLPEPKNPPPPPSQKPQVPTPGNNQIRLILPKIEAGLRPPPKTVPPPVKPSPVPTKKPMSHHNPTSHSNQIPHSSSMSHPSPMSHPNQIQHSSSMSQPNPMSHSNKMSHAKRALPPVLHVPTPVPHASPLQSRPLPTPHEAAGPSRPLPPDPRPLPPDPIPPIYQMPEEDNRGRDSDDEEWTYEPLEKYNFYNM